jgi:hypothetical protein
MVTHPVLSAERRRAAAVTSRDLAELAACLHEDLVFVHATGARHGKGDLLRSVERGPIFIAVYFGVQQLVDLGEAVLLHGELRLQLRRADEAEVVSAQSWASAAWQRGAGEAWQLRLFQSTRSAP